MEFDICYCNVKFNSLNCASLPSAGPQLDVGGVCPSVGLGGTRLGRKITTFCGLGCLGQALTSCANW